MSLFPRCPGEVHRCHCEPNRKASSLDVSPLKSGRQRSHADLEQVFAAPNYLMAPIAIAQEVVEVLELVEEAGKFPWKSVKPSLEVAASFWLLSNSVLVPFPRRRTRDKLLHLLLHASKSARQAIIFTYNSYSTLGFTIAVDQEVLLHGKEALNMDTSLSRSPPTSF